MEINIIDKNEFLSVNAEKKKYLKIFRLLTGKILKEEKINVSCLNIVFCSDEFIRKYNKKYLDHDYETDIITFCDTDHNSIQGDLLISLDSVRYNSKAYKVSFESELMRVFIHGILHLCGYNDANPDEKKIMKHKENYFLKQI